MLAKVAKHRGWLIVQTYEDQGISGAKGRDQRPAFDTMLKDAGRLTVRCLDGPGRSTGWAEVCCTWQMPSAELDTAGVALYSDQQAIDSTTRRDQP